MHKEKISSRRQIMFRKNPRVKRFVSRISGHIVMYRTRSVTWAFKVRRDKGRLNTSVSKVSRPRFMHFCKGECYAKHACGKVPTDAPGANIQ